MREESYIKPDVSGDDLKPGSDEFKLNLNGIRAPKFEPDRIVEVLSKAEIWLVEPDVDLMKHLERNLRDAGFRHVKLFSEFSKFWSELLESSRKPDLLLISSSLGLINVLEICKAMKRTDITADISIIVLSKSLSLDFRKRAFEIGVDDVILKPINTAELMARVKMLLTKKYIAYLEKRLIIERMRQEEEKRLRQAYRDIIAAVTSGKLILEDRDSWQRVVEGRQEVLTYPLKCELDVKSLREKLGELLERVGMPHEKRTEFLIAVGEISTNAIKHAPGGYCKVFLDDSEVIVLISDEGKGIDFSKLARATLLPGYSTVKCSLGFGFTIAIELADRIHLVSDRSGTVVLLRKWLKAQDSENSQLEKLLERFDIEEA